MGNTGAGEGEAVTSGGVVSLPISDEDGVAAQAVRDKSITPAIRHDNIFFIAVYRLFYLS